MSQMVRFCGASQKKKEEGGEGDLPAMLLHGTTHSLEDTNFRNSCRCTSALTRWANIALYLSSMKYGHQPLLCNWSISSWPVCVSKVCNGLWTSLVGCIFPQAPLTWFSCPFIFWHEGWCFKTYMWLNTILTRKHRDSKQTEFLRCSSLLLSLIAENKTHHSSPCFLGGEGRKTNKQTRLHFLHKWKSCRGLFCSLLWKFQRHFEGSCCTPGCASYYNYYSLSLDHLSASR